MRLVCSSLALTPLIAVLAGCTLHRELTELRELTEVQESEITRLQGALSARSQGRQEHEEQSRRELAERDAVIREREDQIRMLQTHQSEDERELADRVAELETELRTREAALAGRDAEVEALRTRERALQADLSSTEAALRSFTAQMEDIRRLLSESRQGAASARESEADVRGAMEGLRERIQDDLDARDAMIADLRGRLLALQEEAAAGGPYSEAELERIESYLRETLETVQGPRPTLRRDPRRGVIITYAGDDLFESRTTIVGEAGLRSLTALGFALQQLEETSVTVVGHTDNEPVRRLPFRDNWQLSALRAENVLRALLEHGQVPPERCTFTAAGEHQAVEANATAEGRRANRRVEIIAAPDRES
jgi:flagellar motor protein MotB